jgi:hypothetical protein
MGKIQKYPDDSIEHCALMIEIKTKVGNGLSPCTLFRHPLLDTLAVCIGNILFLYTHLPPHHHHHLAPPSSMHAFSLIALASYPPITSLSPKDQKKTPQFYTICIFLSTHLLVSYYFLYGPCLMKLLPGLQELNHAIKLRCNALL